MDGAVMTNSNSPKPETDPATEDVTEEDLDNVSGGGAAERAYTVAYPSSCLN